MIMALMARSCPYQSSRDQQMWHAREIGSGDPSVDVFAHGDRELGLGARNS